MELAILPQKIKYIASRSFVPVLLTLPCLIATVLINKLEITAQAIIYDGSPLILLRNLSLICTAPYLFVVFLSIGDLVGFSNKRSGSLNLAETRLISLFAGASLVSLFGMLLGLMGLLLPQILISFTCLASFTFFYRNSSFLPETVRWVYAYHEREESFAHRGLLILIRVVFLFLIGILMTSQAWKVSPDIYQVYLPVFGRAKLNHSSLLDSISRDGFGFLVARGRGVLLFFTSLTTNDGLGIANFLYAILISLMTCQITNRLMSGLTKSVLPLKYSQKLVSDCFMLFVFWWLATQDNDVNIGRTHLETGAFLMFFLWCIFVYFYIDKVERSRLLFQALLLPAIALPFILPTSTFVIGITLGILIFVALKYRDFSTGKNLVAIGLVATIAMTCSLLLNQFYIGIAEVNPYQLFLPFSNIRRLSEWSSVEFLYYVNNAQGIEYSPQLNFSGLISFISNLLHRLWDISVNSTQSSKTLQIFFLGSILYLYFFMVQQLRIKSKSIYKSFLLLLSYLAITSVMVAFTSHGSLIRLFGFQLGLGPLISMLPMLFLSLSPEASKDRNISFVWLLVLGFFLSFLVPTIHWFLISILFCFVALGLLDFRHCLSPKFVKIFPGPNSSFKFWITLGTAFALTFANASTEYRNYSNSLQVFTGKTGLAAVSRWLPALHCEQYLRVVPEKTSILPLNASFTIAPLCSASPFLEPNRVIETLHPPFATDFGPIMLGTPEEEIALFKKWKVNHFLVQKKDVYFWAAGTSDLFSKENLTKYFDISFEDSATLLFTWRGDGYRKLNLEDANNIDLWRKTWVNYDVGPNPLREWLKLKRFETLRNK